MYKDIDKDQLDNMIKNGEDFLLIDVRSKEDYEENHIDNAINIPMNKLLVELYDIEDYKEKDVVIYCTSGHISITACNLLLLEGFTSIYNLKNGIKKYNKVS